MVIINGTRQEERMANMHSKKDTGEDMDRRTKMLKLIVLVLLLLLLSPKKLWSISWKKKNLKEINSPRSR